MTVCLLVTRIFCLPTLRWVLQSLRVTCHRVSGEFSLNIVGRREKSFSEKLFFPRRNIRGRILEVNQRIFHFNRFAWSHRHGNLAVQGTCWCGNCHGIVAKSPESLRNFFTPLHNANEWSSQPTFDDTGTATVFVSTGFSTFAAIFFFKLDTRLDYTQWVK